ncbi:MAG: tripartite tricarboxylate transporter permease [Desulfobacterales bacterium]
MDIFNNLIMGFGVALQPVNLAFIGLGQLIGVSIGVLPGINASMAVAVLLPLTFGLSPEASLLFLSGIYMGAMFGGSITSILIRVPGTSTAAVIALDGYEMTRQGRAGLALGITAIGSWVAGTFSVIVLMSLGPWLSTVALAFGPPEYFALIFLGLSMITSLGSDSLAKGLIAGAFGLLLGTIGLDTVAGVSRFTFGILELDNGVNFIAVLIGMFAVSQSLLNLKKSRSHAFYKDKMTGLLPSLAELKESAGSILRGTVLGTFIGMLPGAGATASAFMSYSIEARISKHPERVGKGDIKCVAGPGSADNSAAGGALVPLLSLGIPGSETTAVLLGALMIHGIRPGPMLFSQHSQLVWATIASLYIANTLGLILATAGIRPLTQILKLPTPIMSAFILVMSVVGSYSLANSMVDVWIVWIFGIIGYLMKTLRIPVAPVILALVLGPMAEKSFRQSLYMSDGSLAIFVTRPITVVMLILGLISLFLPIIIATVRRGKK